jgi:hypothetical protein
MGKPPFTFALSHVLLNDVDLPRTIRLIVMLFDVFFFGFPLAICVCLGAHGIRERDIKFWRPAFCFLSYCAFYMAGGREVLLYLSCLALMGSGLITEDSMTAGGI